VKAVADKTARHIAAAMKPKSEGAEILNMSRTNSRR
jgi:hypothetical protein